MHKVGTISALRKQSPLKATVGDKRLLVFLINDVPVATQARCPHAQGPLHEAEICDTVLTCAWHGWQFDLVSGKCEEDPALVLERYAVKIEGDDIYVTV